MKFYSLFYTDSKFRPAEANQINALVAAGFNGVFPYRREWLITTDFYKENKEILDMPRGGGYWLWKPYIILDAMSKIEDNDVLMYVDAGDEIYGNIVNSIASYINNHEYIITNFSGQRGANKVATKRDCFVLMNCDEEKYHNIPQIEAGVLVFKKTEYMILFINEWLSYCKNKNIITDIPNEHGNNLEGFVDHRHDQSILTNLTVRHNFQYSDVLLSHINYNAYIPKP